MFNLISNEYGRVYVGLEAGGEPLFVYHYLDNEGKCDDCEYAFTFKGNKIRLYGWHIGQEDTFNNKGNWMDYESFEGAFHDHDYQDTLVERLRMCIKAILNDIVASTIEYL